jgi:RHS repeat-associated protein
MRLIKIFFFSILSFHSYSQSATITGTVLPGTGTTHYYEAHFSSPLNSFTTIDWTVIGGTIVSEVVDPTATTIFCYIEWSGTPQPGAIDISESIGGQNGFLNVQVGTPTLVPSSQLFNFGSTPQFICVEIATIPNTSYAWQKSTDGVNWDNVTGTDPCFTPTDLTFLNYYRSIVTVGSTTFYTDAATVDINSLNPGSISMSTQPNYNTVPVISNTAASGGLCLAANYQYVWEQSVEGGPWTAVGTSVGYPVGAPAIVGNTLIRRSITCASQTLYTNIISVVPNYTPIDFENRTYVRTYTIATRGVQSRAQADQLDVGKKFQQTEYLDGLGRTIQVVNKGISQTPGDTWNDMVAFANYDNLGRPVVSNLPYPTTDLPGKFKTSTVAQVTFYSTNYNEIRPWSKTEYEDNAISRIKKQIDPGDYRLTNNIGKSVEYDFNNASSTQEKVHVWRITYTAGALPTSSATDIYQNGVLVKNIVTDEYGKKVIEYQDFNGKVILKKVQLEDAPNLSIEHAGWLCTYYVYDDFGRLRFIITPKAVAWLDANSWSLTQTIADELCYSYEYDERGRVISKKVPGATKLNMIYDLRDRLVFTQDGNQANRSPKEWSVNFYDASDRVVMTGIYKSNKTLADLQTDLINAGSTANITIPGDNITNLVISERSLINPPALYEATQTIEFVPDFESQPGDEFIAQINPLATGPSILLTVSLTGIPPVDIENPAVFTALSYHYFDNYNFPGVKAFDNAYNNHQAYLPSDPDVEPIEKSVRTLSMATGSKVRVLGSSAFLLTTVYYNEEGEVIQTLGDNYKQGQDIVTLQYHFDGRVLSSYTKHNVPGGTFDGFGILTKNVYDKIGRIKTLLKKYGPSGFKKIADYAYDELGHLKSRKLGKKPLTEDPLETINYSYNAYGTMTGINKDYALSTIDADQYNNYFGLYLDYENFDSKFASARYDHLITGLIWKSQGDNTPRKFDYGYDNAGRLTKADFVQKNTPSAGSWSNSQFDFSETDIEYDENGNLKQLNRKGVVPGNSSALYVDKLQYTYKTVASGEWSNQLLKVFDNSPGIGSTGNGKLGDFKDEVYNSNTDDYTFDANGNLVKDNNKKIRNGSQDGIIYNHMDKPEKITIENGSTVEFFYDAAGIKLAKKITPQSGPARTTYYIGEFVYLDNDLQFLLHEEGRVRIMTPENSVSPLGAAAKIVTGNDQFVVGKWGVYEYFIKDHLGSVRMVLTEETHKEVYLNTMETASAGEENQLFGKVDNNGNPTSDNEVIATRLDAVGWSGHTKISKLFTTSSSTTNSIGPNMLLKVMAGDYITAETEYQYNAPTSTGHNDILNSVVNSLIGGFAGSGASNVVKDAAGNIQTAFQNPSGPIYSYLTSSRPAPGTNQPKAYLNYLFFDENFNYVSSVSGATIVNPSVNFIQALNLRAPKNGYAFIFLSNESDLVVQFDNFKVIHERSAIVEESHYYAHGLKIAGISSRAYSKLPNNYGFQGEFAEFEEESGYDEFELRMFDVQIGRWIQNDPYDEFASGYVGMGNDPVNNVDVDGGSIGGLAAIAGAIIGGGIVYAIANHNNWNKELRLLAAFGGALAGAGIGYGVGASLTSGGPLQANIAAFYEGLFAPIFGTDDLVYQSKNHSWYINSSWYSVDVPDIWGLQKEVGGVVRDFTPFAREINHFPTRVIGNILQPRQFNIPTPGIRSIQFPPARQIQVNSSISSTTVMSFADQTLSFEQMQLSNNLSVQLNRGIRTARQNIPCQNFRILSITVTMIHPPSALLNDGPIGPATGANATANGTRIDDPRNFGLVRQQRRADGIGFTRQQNMLAQTRRIGARIANILGAPNATIIPRLRARGNSYRIRVRLNCLCF